MHDLVHHLERVESDQVHVRWLAIGVLREIGRDDRVLYHLIGERQTDGVIAIAFDLIEDRVIVLRP